MLIDESRADISLVGAIDIPGGRLKIRWISEITQCGRGA